MIMYIPDLKEMTEQELDDLINALGYLSDSVRSMGVVVRARENEDSIGANSWEKKSDLSKQQAYKVLDQVFKSMKDNGNELEKHKLERVKLLERYTRETMQLRKKIERLEEELDICKAELKIEMDRW